MAVTPARFDGQDAHPPSRYGYYQIHAFCSYKSALVIQWDCIGPFVHAEAVVLPPQFRFPT
jgi:hypothetical protein